ncbi:MAG TPA: DNA methyltransferase [Pyrinomonadaceae bacterium]|nr:DNA methyltransferase [Pyrinomonadaceae bacterium]
MKRAVKTSRKVFDSQREGLESLHRFHSYCARFPSELAEAAIANYSNPGDSVLDPFCGSGTTLVAGLTHGRKVIGADIDVLAGMLSEVKCFVRSPSDYKRWRSRFGAKLEGIFTDIENEWSRSLSPRPGATLSFGSRALGLPGFEELNYWFPPQLTVALAGIAEAAHECREPHYEKVALVSLSASIVAKWPNTLSYAMDIDHTRPHRQVQQFRLNGVLRAYLARLDRTIGCLGNLYKIYDTCGVAEKLPSLARIACPHDAREPLPNVQEGSQALVVTSPPYFNAVDYPRAHRMSVCWMNGYAPTDLTSRHDYIGLHGASGFDSDEWLSARPEIRRLIARDILTNESLGRRLSGFFADLEKVLREIRKVLRPGGHAVIVIGDNVIKGQRVASHSAMVQLAQAIDFQKLEASQRKIATLRRRYPVGPFGFDGPMTHEFILVLRKPPSKGSAVKRRTHGRKR